MFSRKLWLFLYPVFLFGFAHDRQSLRAGPPSNYGMQGGGGSANVSDGEELNFKETMTGEGIALDGSRYPFHTWKSSDGVTVTSAIQSFSSERKARQAFLRRLKQAAQVIENKPRMKASGRPSGERAVAIFSYPNQAGKFAGILWTNGRELHDVESLSMRHALAFERTFYAAP